MIEFSSQKCAWVTTIAVVLLVVGCAGRTTSSNRGDDTDISGDGGTTPVPTCAEICRHVVDSCFPGAAILQCERDCESTRTEYAGCNGLDPFLRCNLTARVVCTDGAIIDDCYEQRNELERCKS